MVFSTNDLLSVSCGFVVWLYAITSILPSADPVFERILAWTFADTTSTPWLLAAAGISTSHVLYALVWYNADSFRRLCGTSAVDVFAILVGFSKIVQQVSVVAFALHVVGDHNKLLAAMTGVRWAAVAALIVCGQTLNYSIYSAIGKDGVYYGFKLGRPVPWSSAFPFNAGFRHPQYVGGLLSQLGVLTMLATTETMAAGLLPLTIFWTALYAITSWMEASGDNDGGKVE